MSLYCTPLEPTLAKISTNFARAARVVALTKSYAPILTPSAAEDGGLASQKISLAFLICARPSFSELWKGHFLLGFRAKARAGAPITIIKKIVMSGRSFLQNDIPSTTILCEV